MIPKGQMYSIVIAENLTFGQAMDECIHRERKVTRAVWGGYWSIQEVECFSTPVLVAELRDNGGQAPATPYLADMLATDWMVVE